MKIIKRISTGGKFAKLGKDYQENDILTIVSEGEMIPGEFGEKYTCKVTCPNNDEKMNVSFNQTSLNYLVDAYGDDSTSWLGKQIRANIVDQNVSGKIRAVVYFTSPTWKKIRENGELKFVPATDAPKVPNREEGEADEDEIPM